jgi:hypothetical protein
MYYEIWGEFVLCEWIGMVDAILQPCADDSNFCDAHAWVDGALTDGVNAPAVLFLKNLVIIFSGGWYSVTASKKTFSLAAVLNQPPAKMDFC